MKHAVRRVLLTSALMTPTALYALGLGEIRLNSGLNQPFDAEIELVSATSEDLASLRAVLAPSDTFTRYGLDRPTFLSDFTFRVARGSGGRDVLRVTSPRPVTEPFVTLLVEANWARGRLLREYTVLLDPPVFAPPAERAETPVATPRAAEPPREPAPAPVGREPAEPVAVEPSRPAPAPAAAPRRTALPAPTLQPGQTYAVRQNDTLWQIANQVNPGSNSNVNRAMVAIYQANPTSFEGNINLLKAGSTLRIPGQGDISAISAAAAAQEVARQYRLWQEGSTATAAEGADAGRLRLVTPEQGTPGASTVTTKPAAAASTAAAGASELQSRVQQLETELAEARRLLEVRNAELATLQGQAAGAATPPGAAVTPTSPAPSEVPAEGAQAAAEAPAAAAAPAAEPAGQAPAEPAAKPKPRAKPVAEEPSFLGRLMEYWWALGGLLVAGLAGWWLYRRRSAEPDTDAALEESFATREAADLRSRASAATRTRESQIVVEEKRPAEPTPAVRPAVAAAAAAVTPRAPEPTRKPVSIEDTIQTEGPVEVGTGDPLAEADFHMAYGLYDQAADLIQLAIRREPLRRELKLKLLEIFFVWGNRDKFLEVAREMNATRSEALPGEWDKVLIMGKQIASDDPIFAGAAKPSVAELDMDLQGGERALDFDLREQDATAPDIDLTGSMPAVAGEVELDFVLDEPVRGADEYPTQAPTVETPVLDRGGATVRTAMLEPTQELPIESLGIDTGDLETLSGLEDVEDMLATRPGALVEDTAENRQIAEESLQDAADDLLSSTSILKAQTGTMPALSAEEFAEATGELPTIKTQRPPGLEASIGEVAFPVGEEAATMSEVGTKLDLARAYIDMGDPEGARSILDEVVGEGNAKQKQEAQRLLATLP